MSGSGIASAASPSRALALSGLQGVIGLGARRVDPLALGSSRPSVSRLAASARAGRWLRLLAAPRGRRSPATRQQRHEAEEIDQSRLHAAGSSATKPRASRSRTTHAARAASEPRARPTIAMPRTRTTV